MILPLSVVRCSRSVVRAIVSKTRLSFPHPSRTLPRQPSDYKGRAMTGSVQVSWKKGFVISSERAS